MNNFTKKLDNYIVISDSDPEDRSRDSINDQSIIYNVDSGDTDESANNSRNTNFNNVDDSVMSDPILILDDDETAPVKKKRKRIIKSDEKKKNKKRKKQIDLDTDSESDDAYIHYDIYGSDDSDPEIPEKELFSRKDKILHLLNTGAYDRLILLPTLSVNRVHAIMSCRPFANWNNLVQKMKNTRDLKPEILNSLDKFVLAETIVSDLTNKCMKLASNIREYILSKKSLVSVQPSLLNTEYQLKNYQLVGLNWLAAMHDHSENMILADEMGLGKTIQVIAFLAYLKEINHTKYGVPHLIVVPASTLENWNSELTKWCPSFKVTIYHGSLHVKRAFRNKWFKVGFDDTEIVLSTYECVSRASVDKKLFRTVKFNYVIFDEAHKLKNMTSKAYDALIRCNGNHKMMLTGTPLQNNLLELISLLNFLKPNLFGAKIEHVKFLFSTSCSKATDATFEQKKIEQVKKIVEPFMLRRLKEDVLKKLPLKTNETLYCQLETDQAEKYKHLLEEFKAVSLIQTGNIHMTYFIKLRKLASHPLLLRYIFTDDKLDVMARCLSTDETYKDDVQSHIKDDLYFKSDYELHLMCDRYPSLTTLNYQIPSERFNISGKLLKIHPILQNLKADGHRVLIFSQFHLMLDILEEFLKINNHMYLRMDGSTPLPERKEMIDLFNSTPNIFIFLLSTRAGGLGINLTSADTVIIHDIDHNPCNDKQAEDRCHRVGQKKHVKVYRLIAENTVEEGMNDIATGKLHLETEITNDNEEDREKGVVNLLTRSLGFNTDV